MLSFQQLDVYKCAVQFLSVSYALSKRVPRGRVSAWCASDAP